MFKTRWCIFLIVMLLRLLCIQPDSKTNGFDEMEQAAEILKATGVQRGLIIHINCGDGKLTAALGAKDGCLVNGLEKNPQTQATLHADGKFLPQ